MNKKIINFIFIILILLLLYNYSKMVGTYFFTEWNKYYNFANYSWALDKYSITKFFLSDTIIDYNIWNTYYKIWEELENQDNKIEYYKKAIDIYKNLLKNDKYNEYIKYNYAFVKNKLNELEKYKKQEEKQIEKEKQEQKQQEEQKKEEQQKQEQEQEEEEKQEKIEPKEVKPKEVDNTKKNDKQVEINLSEQELIEIDNYIKTLKEEEKYTRQFYNTKIKLNTGSVYQDLNNSNEKDW